MGRFRAIGVFGGISGAEYFRAGEAEWSERQGFEPFDWDSAVAADAVAVVAGGHSVLSLLDVPQLLVELLQHRGVLLPVDDLSRRIGLFISIDDATFSGTHPIGGLDGFDLLSKPQALAFQRLPEMLQA